MSTVYLHVGAPKTGTTALQNFLYKNRVALEKRGVLYPDFKSRFPCIDENRNAHFLIHRVYNEKHERQLKEERKIRKETYEKLEQAVKQSKRVLLSEEMIWNSPLMTQKRFAELKRHVDQMNAKLKIIVYLRRQDLVIASYWGQLVKSRLNMNFDEFISSGKYQLYHLDYAQRMQEIADIVGKENIIVRAYEMGQYMGEEHTLISDFLSIFNLSAKGLKGMGKQYNTGIDRRYLEVKRALNINPAFHEKKNFLVPILKELQAEKEQEKDVGKNYFSGQERMDFLSQFDESNRLVAKEYMKRPDGVLFYEDVDKDKKNFSFGEEELASVCADIICYQEKERQCLEEKLAAYERYFGKIYKGAKHLKKMTKPR